jgi:hypothetical protein
MALNFNHIRCDNSGENKSLQQKITLDDTLKIDFEFVVPYTPKKNEKH